MLFYSFTKKIPLNPPLRKGDFKELAFFPPFLKGGQGGFLFSGFANS